MDLYAFATSLCICVFFVRTFLISWNFNISYFYSFSFQLWQLSYIFILGYNVSYTEDRQFLESKYTIRSDETKIMTEIMTNGPVEGAFTVFADFPNYKSGLNQFLKKGKLLIIKLQVNLIVNNTRLNYHIHTYYCTLSLCIIKSDQRRI